MICLAIGVFSGSSKDLPTTPPIELAKVYAIPPPTIKLSTLSRRDVKTSILLDILAPPIIAVRGLLGFSNAFSKKLISLPSK